MHEIDKDKMNRTAIVIIGSKEYSINTNITISDIRLINDYFENSDKDSFYILSNLVRNKVGKKVDEIPSLELIMHQEESFFLGFINEMLNTNTDLRFLFEENGIKDNIYHKFITSIKVYSDLESKKAFSRITEMSQTMLSSFKFIMPSFIEFNDSINLVLENINIQLKSISMKIDLSLLKQEQLITSHRMWGEMGWTIMPNAPSELFNEAPEDIISSNKKAMSYFRENTIDELFTEILGIKGINKSYVKEAIYAYKNKRYLSCSMILFSIIDSKLIILQRDEDKRKGRRLTGSKAASKLLERLKNEKNIEEMFMSLLIYENTLTCLKVLFSDGEDFKEQPTIINRNFLHHGMFKRKVNRKDCIQLFLLYYNLISFLEFFGYRKEWK